MLKSKRVVLRTLRESDLEKLLKWFNDPEVIQYLHMYLPMTEKAEAKWLEDIGTSRRDTDIVFMMEALDGNDKIPIGTIGLHKISWKDRDAEFGIAIGEKKYWGNGYGTEAANLVIEYAFIQLNIHRVSSVAYSFNERSLKMHLKLGFVQEGVARESAYKNGAYHGKVMFGLLKSEWMKTK